MELLALGTPKERIAAELGVSHKTIDNWKSEHAKAILEAADERTEGVVESVVSGAAEARARCSALAPSMVAVLERLATTSLEPSEAPGAAVNARAAMALLDRGGVPVSTKVDATVTNISDETRQKLDALVEAMARARGNH